MRVQDCLKVWRITFIVFNDSDKYEKTIIFPPQDIMLAQPMDYVPLMNSSAIINVDEL